MGFSPNFTYFYYVSWLVLFARDLSSIMTWWYPLYLPRGQDRVFRAWCSSRRNLIFITFPYIIFFLTFRECFTAECLLTFVLYCTVMGVDLLLSFAHLVLRMAFSRAPSHWSNSQTFPGLDQFSPYCHLGRVSLFLIQNLKSMSAHFIIHCQAPGESHCKKEKKYTYVSYIHSHSKIGFQFLNSTLFGRRKAGLQY
jgi:hypothetical protein